MGAFWLLKMNIYFLPIFYSRNQQRTNHQPTNSQAVKATTSTSITRRPSPVAGATLPSFAYSERRTRETCAADQDNSPGGNKQHNDSPYWLLKKGLDFVRSHTTIHPDAKNVRRKGVSMMATSGNNSRSCYKIRSVELDATKQIEQLRFCLI